ncbi:Protein MSP1 AltName: Full=Tat-binding homolog 4 [Serendipita indica DSM 11827]|uniref:Related to MSP1 protein n=1 Tax=Serendipita indica (strain DSM 11827) TaxID=1109443 RepID=G4T6J8_SERID|nr:Protein MSP1 AltName: Full=Tat-binding homolog 4 [Serendipita indica DSM 11827]CCA66937.1 related to MSP1 protein [Serendipita indica DSM 11827]
MVPSIPTPPPNEPQDDERPAKGRGRPRLKQGVDPKSGDSVQLPPELAESLLWIPDKESHPIKHSLPPEEMMQDALANLHVSLLPKTQHRATHPTSAGPPIEPSITLYCPIEGGTYVIDETVRELARRTNSEVLTLDALDLLAGEWGPYGKAAAALQLPSNPLQLGEFQHARQSAREEDSDDEGDMGSVISQAVEGLQSGRPPFGITIQTRKISSGSSNHQSRKQFFQELVNIQRKGDEDAEPRPRLIYCRDLQLVSESLQHWFPTFVEAVRLRRQGPMPRAQGPIHSPTVIILGVSPSIITPRTTPFIGSEPGGLVNFITNRNRSGMGGRGPVSPPSPPKVVEWDETNAAQRARDRRLFERLSKWEKQDARVFYSELPDLHLSSDSPNPRGPPRGLMSLFVALPGVGGPPAIAPAPHEEDSPRERPSDHERMTVILPRAREPGQEKATRTQRRLQANEINMRTAIGSLGGKLADNSLQEHAAQMSSDSESNQNHTQSMISDWNQRVETWQQVKQVADRAMGLLAGLKKNSGTPTLEPTDVSWIAVAEGWNQERTASANRKDFISSFTSKRVIEHVQPERAQGTEEDEDFEEDSDSEISDIEELIEQLRRDPSLDQHEQRLLGSIVNPKHLPTTFADVHLPAATIDSIRTIVSLPLLEPTAFSYGVLKQHGMNGALLFGAPGTGKTLSVRALARESGARMMIVKPSDVMDMYVGEGEKLVRAVFSLARRISPCVVFIDEIDALLGARYSARSSGGDLAHRGVITEFMQEMDGLKSSRDTNVVVIGATNRPFDLDDAVLRRLPRRLLIDLPGAKEREAILRIHLADEQLAQDVDVTKLAEKTESFSGSDLKHLCVAAALDAVKEHTHLPWNTPKDPSTDVDTKPKSVDIKSSQSESSTDAIKDPNTESPSSTAKEESEDTSNSDKEDVKPRRILRMSHFEKALKEITPSASEQLGSLADLRKWNEEFGEGGRKRGRRIWGGKFGFIVKPEKTEEGRVQQP